MNKNGAAPSKYPRVRCRLGLFINQGKDEAGHRNSSQAHKKDNADRDIKQDFPEKGTSVFFPEDSAQRHSHFCHERCHTPEQHQGIQKADGALM